MSTNVNPISHRLSAHPNTEGEYSKTGLASMSAETRQWLAKPLSDRLFTVPVKSLEFKKGLDHMGDRDAKALQQIIVGDYQIVGGGTPNQQLLHNHWSNAVCKYCKDHTFNSGGKSINLCKGAATPLLLRAVSPSGLVPSVHDNNAVVICSLVEVFCLPATDFRCNIVGFTNFDQLGCALPERAAS